MSNPMVDPRRSKCDPLLKAQWSGKPDEGVRAACDLFLSFLRIDDALLLLRNLNFLNKKEFIQALPNQESQLFYSSLHDTIEFNQQNMYAGEGRKAYGLFLSLFYFFFSVLNFYFLLL